MSHAFHKLSFLPPIAIKGPTGEPFFLRDVEEALDLLQLGRLPIERQACHWLNAYNQLALARLTRESKDVDQARGLLVFALDCEGWLAETLPQH